MEENKCDGTMLLIVTGSGIYFLEQFYTNTLNTIYARNGSILIEMLNYMRKGEP